MKVETYRCDEPSCGRLKGAGNHWFIVNVAVSGSLLIKPFPAMGNPDSEDHTFCGRECVQKRVEQFLQEKMKCQQPAQENAGSQ